MSLTMIGPATADHQQRLLTAPSPFAMDRNNWAVRGDRDHMLDVRRLKVLREVATRGSLAAAARGLSYTPSAISQQISTLEREAGVALVKRTPRGVRLTAAGEALVRRTDTIVSELTKAEAELRTLADPDGGTLRLGAFPSAGAEIVPEAVIAFAARHPRARLHLAELEPDQALPRLKLGELDLVLAHDYDLLPLPHDPALERLTLFSEPVYLVHRRDHPLAGRQPADLRRFADDSWVVGSPGTACERFIMRACRLAGFEPDVAAVCDDLTLTQALVTAGVGVALMPKLGLQTRRPDIMARRVLGGPTRHVFAAWRAERFRSPLITGMLQDGLGCSLPHAPLASRVAAG